ncbi:MAG: sigma-70 family RNA polymerase sigma factor, partial [Thermomicrobiales bacterium]|nr:sigma-70 family RNA polymerase sigma factor [Thermomicrobiales bacterium]
MVFRRGKNANPPTDPAAQQDERLIFAAARGDLDAFNKLVVLHERSVLNLCWRMLGSQHEAEDASQDTFIKAWTNAKSFKGGAVRPWLLRIATNTCYDVLRSKGRRPASSLDAIEFETEPDWSTQSNPVDPVQFAETGDLGRMLEAALSQIPDEQRLAVTLCDIQGLPLAEAAQVMDISLGTVKSRLFRGRAK